MDHKWSGIGRFTRLSERTQNHLRRVYENLTITAALAALSCHMVIRGSLPEPGLLALILMVACLLGAILIPNRIPSNTSNNINTNTVRYAALYGFGFSQGWLAAPLVATHLFVDPQAVLMASMGAAAIFFSFSMSALCSPRREYLYLGGLLGSILGMLVDLFILGPLLTLEKSAL